MSEDETNDIQLNSAQWYCEEAGKYIAKYRACRTEHAKNQLIPKLKELYGKLHFEAEGLKRVIKENE